jgi:3-hydroxyisobutyrate dehydrogenase
MKIGFLGLGKMGSGMAACLLNAGHDVAVWNRSPGRAGDLIARGASEVATPAEAAEGAEAVFAMVADDAASMRCWLADDGAATVMAPGTMMIECSTISHAHTARLAETARDRGLIYLDCPVNGPPAAAASGDLVLLLGASPEDLERARPLLEVISQSILHFGGVGTGTAYKLINNLLGAVHVAAMAEAAVLASNYGIDVDTMVEAIRTGPIASPHTMRMARPMLEKRPADTVGLAIGLREKDARYCLQMAEAAGIRMPVGTQAHDWYLAATATHGECDDSLMLETVSRRSKTA